MQNSFYWLWHSRGCDQNKTEVIGRKHTAHPTGFGAYSSTCYKGTDNWAGTMGVDQLPSSTVRLKIIGIWRYSLYKKVSLWNIIKYLIRNEQWLLVDND